MEWRWARRNASEEGGATFSALTELQGQSGCDGSLRVGIPRSASADPVISSSHEAAGLVGACHPITGGERDLDF